MKTTRLLSLSFGFVLALVVAAACSSPDDRDDTSSGGKDAGVADAGKTDGGQKPDAGEKQDAGNQESCGDVNLGDPACQSCAEDNCCAELADCESGTPCDELARCLAPCQDEACQQQCASQHQNAIAAFNALGQCIRGTCEAECTGGNTDPTPICDSGLSYPDAACAECLGGKCCTEMTDCANDQTCVKCLSGQSSSGCQSNTNVQAAAACGNSNCAAECQ